MQWSGGLFVFLLTLGTQAATNPDTRLADAVMNGDGTAVRALLTEHVDVNAPQPDGMTPLLWAIRQDDLATTEMLLQAGADGKSGNRYGITPLSIACTNGSARVIERLLKAGAEVNRANPSGETPLMTAARTGRVDAIQVLLDHGANVNAKENVHGQTALMWAALENRADAVKLLVAHGAEINAHTLVDGSNMPPNPQRPGTSGAGPGIARQRAQTVASGSMTALLFAAREGNLAMARVLLENGADINQVSANGTSPLVIAIVNNHFALANFLIERGANPNLADSYGRTALFAAVDQKNLATMSFPDPHPDTTDPMTVVEALVAHGANVNGRSNKVPMRGWAQRDGVWVNFDGQTPFLRAAFSGDIAVMRLLAAHGADPLIPTLEGTTPLMAAAGIGWAKGQTSTHSDADLLEAVKLCVERGADVNAVNSNGWTALHGAANRGNDAIVEYLAQHGARLDVKDSEGRTPMNFAEGVFLTVIAPTRHDSTIALLKKLSVTTTASAQ